MALHSLQLMLDKNNLTRDKTQQHCVAVSESVKVLLELGHVRKASAFLRQFGSVCRRLGQNVLGTEHKEYILQVSSAHYLV